MKKTFLFLLLCCFAASAWAMPRAEYPRPQFERQDWLNLNGDWTYAFDFVGSGMEKRLHESRGFTGKITVPFCPESKLSGVGYTDFIGNIWYQRNIRMPQEWAGRNVMLGAADTFRAAAVEQLMLWADRVGVPIVQQGMGADPASVAYDTLQSAISKGSDIVIIDTAGRLHNKVGLMNELTKIRRVMQKLVPDAPHEVLLVLDASTGQNAIEQARQFTEATDVNALALTKLDGTAKGGVIIGISDQFNVPVRYIGLGEKMTDLQLFDPNEFVDSLFEN